MFIGFFGNAYYIFLVFLLLDHKYLCSHSFLLSFSALTLSVANGPTYEDQNQSHRMSQPNAGTLESDRKIAKKSKVNQFFKTMVSVKQDEECANRTN